MPRRSSTPSFEEVKSNTAQLASQLHQLNTRVTNVFSAYKRQDVKTNNVSKNKQDILDQLSKQIELTKAAYDQELDTLREKMKTERDARILAEGYLGSVTAVLDKGKLSEAEELKHIEELQASLKEIQEKLAEKASQIAKDEVYQESLINSNSNLKNYIEKLSDDWKNLLGFSEEVRSHLLDYKSDASSVAELIALFRKGKETKVAALEKEAFELQSYIDSMEMKLKYEFTNDLNELIANNQKHFEAQKNSALEERKNRFESSISELNAHYQRKDARISELEESLVALEKDIADYEGKCDEYEDQNENLNSQLGDIEANILKMKKSSSKRVDTKLNELEKLKGKVNFSYLKTNTNFCS
jgi:chromosome segregation ATPase